jgi:hypothetical protein
VRTALRELDLLDERGHVRAFDPTEKLSPFESPSLLDGLLERYRLRSFVNAYRFMDDEAFAVAVVNLFGPGDGAGGGLAAGPADVSETSG